MGKPTLEHYISEIDGHHVVHIDTDELPENEHGPIMRIYLNDDTDNPLFDNTETEARHG